MDFFDASLPTQPLNHILRLRARGDLQFDEADQSPTGCGQHRRIAPGMDLLKVPTGVRADCDALAFEEPQAADQQGVAVERHLYAQPELIVRLGEHRQCQPARPRLAGSAIGRTPG